MHAYRRPLLHREHAQAPYPVDAAAVRPEPAIGRRVPPLSVIASSTISMPTVTRLSEGYDLAAVPPGEL
ncbi:hypothetical protein ACH427_31745 [Streptomyces sp. NPDC020379]|uniref:hypothetical protein n=1 Tax=Streptomyces sp. NPDC020379 TaxID=3365071 RepID=UPI00379A96B7